MKEASYTVRSDSDEILHQSDSLEGARAVAWYLINAKWREHTCIRIVKTEEEIVETISNEREVPLHG